MGSASQKMLMRRDDASPLGVEFGRQLASAHLARHDVVNDHRDRWRRGITTPGVGPSGIVQAASR
jgi:hypothetical protein